MSPVGLNWWREPQRRHAAATARYWPTIPVAGGGALRDASAI